MWKNWQAGGVIQFHTNTPPNPTSAPYPLKNERSLSGIFDFMINPLTIPKRDKALNDYWIFTKQIPK